MTDLHASIHQAAHSGAFGAHQVGRPSEAQCRAGNYRKGRVVVQGLRIAIEVPRNEERRGVDPNGTAWACRMAAHYGYFEKTRGRDGDEVDVFLGPVPESPRVYVVNQNDDAGAFDEHKVMLGFNDAEAARAAYLGSYSPGWKGLGSIVGATVSQLRWWLKHGDTARPFSANALPYDGEADMTPTTWDANAMPVETDLAALLYNMRRSEDAPLLLDAVTAADVLEGGEELAQFDALVVVNQRLSAKMEQIQRVMATASDTVEPTALQITPPFRQRGTTHICAIFELSDGQTVTIWFHNPDSTPNKILPTDELVSWKWMLNKLDITIVVAPERGRDLNPREVARRIMRLAEKNSARFQKANAGRAERLAKVEQLRGEVTGKEAQLQGLEAEIEALTAQLEAKRAEPEPVADPEPAAGAIPESVLRMVRYHVAALQRLAKRFDDVIAARGYGHTLDLELAEYQSEVDKSLEELAKIREVADRNGADLDSVIAELGGVPDFAKYREAPAPAEAFADRVRRLIPDEFVTTSQGSDDITAMAADGFGIRVMLKSFTSGRISAAAYVVDAKGQDSMGHASPDEVQSLIADALSVIAEKRAAVVPDPQPEPEPIPEPQPVQIPGPTPEPETNPAQDVARALLQAVIDGSEDLFASDLAARLEEVYNAFTEDAEIMALFEEAAGVYSAAVVAKAKEALAAA